MSKCISETLTLLLGSSARWNISLATVSNPVYCEANALPHRGEIQSLWSQVEPPLSSVSLAPYRDVCDQWKCALNMPKEALGSCLAHQSSPANCLVTRITALWVLNQVCLSVYKNCYPFTSMKKCILTQFLTCKTGVRERMGAWVSL